MLGELAVLRREAGAGARVRDQADREADGDRDQRGDHEPEDGAACQPGGVVDLAQVGDRHQDREEDERRDGQLQQLDEDVADLVERGVEPLDVVAAGEPAEQDAEHEAGDDLGPERDLGYAETGAGGLIGGGGRGVRGHGHTPDVTHRDARGRGAGDGGAAPASGAAPLHDAGSDVAATDRGHTAAEIDMQALHERDARGRSEAHSCLHVEHVNT